MLVIPPDSWSSDLTNATLTRIFGICAPIRKVSFQILIQPPKLYACTSEGFMYGTSLPDTFGSVPRPVANEEQERQ